MATISTAALQPTTTLPVTTVPDLSSLYTNNINSVANLTQQANDAVAAEKTAQDQYLAKANEKANLEASYGMKANDTASLYQSSGVNDLYKQISGINTEAQGLSREALAIPLALQNQSANRGVTVGGIAPIQAAQLRENALKSLELGQRAAIAQGNYDVAKNLADQQIASKYAGIDAEIKAKQTNLEALDKITLTAAQEKRKAAQTALLTKQANDIAEQKANDKALSDIIIQASTQNAPANLLEKAKLAKTPAAAAMILGQYAGDYYKTELLKSQIKTEAAQQANYYANVAKTKAETKNLTPNTILTGNDMVVANLTPKDKTTYLKMQGDFDTAVKNYKGAIDATSNLKALSKDATAQDQTAIIFSYMKALDPASTVREGEFALVASTAGLNDRAVNALKKLDNGQRLNETQIKDIVGAGEKLSKTALMNLEGTAAEYDRRASQVGLPKGLFYSKPQSIQVSGEDAAADMLINANNKVNQQITNPTVSDTAKNILNILYPNKQ